MPTIHPQYIHGSDGKPSFVIVTVREFKTIIEELEALEDVRLYDEAKKEDTGKRILFSDYLDARKSNHA